MCSESIGSSGNSLRTCRCDENLSGCHHGLFVGEADRFSCLDGSVGCFQSGDADDGGDHEVGLGHRGHPYSTGSAIRHFDACDSSLF